VPDQCGAGFVGDVPHQGHKAPADDLQRGSFNLFTSRVVKIAMEPPKQRCTGGHFDEAVQGEADKQTDPVRIPATMETDPRRCCRRW